MHIHRLILLAGLLFSMLTGPLLAASVVVVVNGKPITDFQINQRAAFFRLEGRGASNADRSRMARQQLIEDLVILDEAERFGFTVSDREVDAAFQRVASNAKLSPSRLTQMLSGAGTSEDTLKARIRSQLAWQQIVQNVLRGQVQLSELELDLQAGQQVESTTYDFILKEVLFVIPQGSNVSVQKRTAEANQYRKSFQGCDSAIQLSLSYLDAAVIDVGRRHSTQLPDALAKELAGLNVGGISSPRTGQRGVSMLAICAKAEAKDLTFVKSQLRSEQGSAELKDRADAHLAELVAKAEIVNK